MGLFRKSIELGFGALLLTKDAAEELIHELTDDDGLERERAREIVDDLARRAGALRDELAGAVRHEVDQAVNAAGLVRRAEFDKLAAKVAALEARAAAGRTFEGTSDF